MHTVRLVVLGSSSRKDIRAKLNPKYSCGHYIFNYCVELVCSSDEYNCLVGGLLFRFCGPGYRHICPYLCHSNPSVSQIGSSIHSAINSGPISLVFDIIRTGFITSRIVVELIVLGAPLIPADVHKG